MANGTVVRFDRRRGYGFVAPDDGGEDVFVHQNNINMEGFRYLQVGERVTFDLEVSEKGMKAVSVSLVEPRQPRPAREENGDFQQDAPPADADGGYRQRPAPRPARPRPPRDGGDGGDVQKLRRKLERLITLLVEKNVLQPGDIDGMDAAAPAKSVENQQA